MNEVARLQQALAQAGYVAEPALSAALLLMLDLQRPLLLEGDAGVGKTEVAKALAAVRATRLIRLQCYEGLDAHAAMYEWNYQRQLLAIKLLEQDDRSVAEKEQDIFSERYLLKRPLLEAISCDQPPVLLIDEVDRADAAFEAYLLELLSDFQLSIPELGTVRAVSRPLVVITSNGTRELSDALRRRCLYQYIDYPDHEKELAIVRMKAPQAAPALARQIVSFVQAVRQLELQKKPGVAETLDWTAALLRLGVATIDRDGAERILQTLGALIKTREDRPRFRAKRSRDWRQHAEHRRRGRARRRAAGRLSRFPAGQRLRVGSRRRGGGPAGRGARRRARSTAVALEPEGAAVRAAATSGGASTNCSTPGSCRRTAGLPRRCASGGAGPAGAGRLVAGRWGARRGAIRCVRAMRRAARKRCPRPTSVRWTSANTCWRSRR
jgi:MoxR-like ATPase